jgi:hypothetical protein
VARAVVVGLVIAAQAPSLWCQLPAPQSNVDRVAQRIAAAVSPLDLVVVVPWYYGVSFDRYYRGRARWLTLPEIEDHRFHRYDLLKERLAAEHPLDDLLAAVATTLRRGDRVWLAGAMRWPQPGEAVPSRPRAPLSPAGWNDYPYIIDWSLELGQFVQSHAKSRADVVHPADSSGHEIEHLALVVVQGWR